MREATVVLKTKVGWQPSAWIDAEHFKAIKVACWNGPVWHLYYKDGAPARSMEPSFWIKGKHYFVEFKFVKNNVSTPYGDTNMVKYYNKELNISVFFKSL